MADLNKDKFFFFKNWWWFVATMGIIGVLIFIIEMIYG